MIVPMKKVSVLVLDSEKKQALQQLRRLGLLHIETSSGTGERLTQLKEQTGCLEQALFALEDLKEKTAVQQQSLNRDEALAQAQQILALGEERKDCRSAISAAQTELDRLKKWGDVDPAELQLLAEKGISFTLCELPLSEYQRLGEEVVTIPVNRDKNSIRFLALPSGEETEGSRPIDSYQVTLPTCSTEQLRQQIVDSQQRLAEIDTQLRGCICYTESIKQAIASLQKDAEFEGYVTGMVREVLSDQPNSTAVACLTGYLPAEDLDTLKAAAREHSWGLAAADPDQEDNVPTKLHNNKFVSLIYPLTDFLGTVPGYFEYDISGWFLAFILVFFGIIFGDGGYGLLITGVGAALIGKNVAAKKPIPPLFLLITLFGVATILWGTVTCTWFGLTPDQLPQWLQNLSIPVISNVNGDKLWYPFWTAGQAGLTTAQNLQIFCFSLALIQLTVAHVKGMIRNRRSLQALGDLGSILQLWGIFYVVLCLVVNGQVFPLDLVLAGIPVGTVAIVLIGVGFVLSFIFASYEGSIKESVLDSCKNIISILLGVVNVFSDIVSYIRLWAVGLAGAAISATVNEMAGPMFGSLVFIVFAVILLVFGHGLNMILNVLSVIVHGVRLNTLEFSSHLGISWSGHKYEPFQE